MERDSHDSISVVESLFDPITVMNVNIEVEYSRVDFQQFKNANNDIVDVAEATSL